MIANDSKLLQVFLIYVWLICMIESLCMAEYLKNCPTVLDLSLSCHKAIFLICCHSEVFLMTCKIRFKFAKLGSSSSSKGSFPEK